MNAAVTRCAQLAKIYKASKAEHSIVAVTVCSNNYVNMGRLQIRLLRDQIESKTATFRRNRSLGSGGDAHQVTGPATAGVA